MSSPRNKRRLGVLDVTLMFQTMHPSIPVVNNNIFTTCFEQRQSVIRTYFIDVAFEIFVIFMLDNLLPDNWLRSAATCGVTRPGRNHAS